MTQYNGFGCVVYIDGKKKEYLEPCEVAKFGSISLMPEYFARKHHVKMSRIFCQFGYTEEDCEEQYKEFMARKEVA